MVKKRVGRRMTRAKPMAVTMNSTAPRRPRIMPARMAKVATEIVRMRKSPMAGPEMAMWEPMKDLMDFS